MTLSYIKRWRKRSKKIDRRAGKFRRLRTSFNPGARYAYSGEDFILLQFVLERGLGIDVGEAMQSLVFDRLQMISTSRCGWLAWVWFL